MTTYTLTQAQYDTIFNSDNGYAVQRVLTSLKPNSQGLVAKDTPEAPPYYDNAQASAWQCGWDAGNAKYTPSSTHPAPMSKEDMVEVLAALQSEIDIYEDDPDDGAPEHLYRARDIMQATIERTK